MEIFTDVKSGFKFCVLGGNDCSNHMVKNRIFEYDLIKWCEQFVTTNGTFVDIGSHIGTYSVILSKKCKQVIAFEPQEKIYECLNTSITCNNCNNIITYNVGLGSEECEKTLYHVSEDGGGSSLLQNTNKKVISTEKIIIKTLDNYNLSNIDFLKIDVEGYELEVLKGAANTLYNNKYPPFIFEVWPHEWYKTQKETLLNYVEKLGYKVYPIKGYNNMYLASDHPERITEINSLIKSYENNDLSEFVSWDVWHTLANHYRNIREYKKSYDCAMKGLKTVRPVDKEYLFYEEISIVAYYLNKKSEGYDACDKVILSNYAPWNIKNNTLNNQSYYMTRIPFSEIYPVDYSPPEKYINSSSAIIKHKDGYIINLRSVNYSINDNGGYVIRDHNNIVRTRNFILHTDNKFAIKSSNELIDKSGIPLYPQNILGIEDIRLINSSEFFCTYLEVNNSRTPQVCYGKYNCETGDVTHMYPLQVTEKLQCEKNWMPFEKDGDLYFVYSIDPLKIYKVCRNNDSVTLILHLETSLQVEDLSQFRGGAGLIPYNDGWLGTIHQVYHSNPRKYFHRFIWFDHDFITIKYSRVFYFENPQIEFNLSICHSSDGLLVPYSVNDNCSKIGVLKYEMLDSMLNN